MNPVLDEIMKTRRVLTRDGKERPLESEVSREEGEYLAKLVEEVKPTTSLEIGLACGISALFICEALTKNGKGRHIAIDPGQLSPIPSDDWQGIGLANLERAGYRPLVEFHGVPSEMALPHLLEQGVRVQLAFIDGWHTFDHVMLDFFYINRMIDVGGVVAFDDADLPGIAKALHFIASLPAYEFHGTAGYRRRFLPYRLAENVARKAASLFPVSASAALSAHLPSRWRLRVQKGMVVAMRKIAEDQRTWNWHVSF